MEFSEEQIINAIKYIPRGVNIMNGDFDYSQSISGTGSNSMYADNSTFPSIQGSSTGSQLLVESNTLEVFEEQFEVKYKVKFEDFVSTIMKDYPELNI